MLFKPKKQLATVVNIRKSDFDVYCGRAGHSQDGYFGNPIKLQSNEDRGATLQLFEKYFNDRIKNDQEYKRRVLALAGMRLGCFCKPHACHVDIIAKWVNEQQH